MRKIILLLSVAFVLIVSCDNPFWSSPPSKQPVSQDSIINDTIVIDTVVKLNYDDEAESIAVCYFNLLEAPDSLSQRIFNEMTLIDSQWHDSISSWSNFVGGSFNPDDDTTTYLRYVPPWRPSLLFLYFTNADFPSIVDSSNTEFYNTLQTLNYDSLVLFSSPPIAYLYLEGIQNPRVAATKFADNPAIKSTSIYEQYGFGEHSNIYPSFEEGNSKYFYFFGWGGCEVGCTNANIFYFEIIDGIATLAGIFNSDRDRGNAPDWYSIYYAAKQKWRKS